MSEIPALRDALVGAAARRVRRRRRQAVTIIGWTAVAAAVATLLVLNGSEPRERERPARTPEPKMGLLERAFPVFARAEREGDALPREVLGDGVPPFGLADRQSRLVLEDGNDRVWLAAGTRDGGDWMCVVRAGSGLLGKGECKDLATFARDGATGWAQPRFGEAGMLLTALPAGARDAQVTLATGTVLTPALQDGVALLRFPHMAIAAGWTDEAGTRHIQTLAQSEAGPPDPQGCPRLDPLPPDADARARRAALMAADYLYAGLATASVTGVSHPGRGVCTRAVTDRTLNVELRLVPTSARARRSSSLTQGRLLVGMVQGRMTVWMVQH